MGSVLQFKRTMKIKIEYFPGKAWTQLVLFIRMGSPLDRNLIVCLSLGATPVHGPPLPPAPLQLHKGKVSHYLVDWHARLSGGQCLWSA